MTDSKREEPVTHEAVPEDVRLRAAKLVKDGYQQISRRHRTVARLPPGKTGSEALLEEARRKDLPDAEEWVRTLGEVHAASHFLRVYARYHGLDLDLDQATFAEFRRQGGTAA